MQQPDKIPSTEIEMKSPNLVNQVLTKKNFSDDVELSEAEVPSADAGECVSRNFL